ncbi:hypothetical protein ACVBEF_21010 [Glaciimonas sp. GG7]
MNNFEIDFVSDCDHEYLMAEISYRKQRLCLINKEQGNDSMEIEFLTDLYLLSGKINMKFPLSEFEAVIKGARDELRDCK